MMRWFVVSLCLVAAGVGNFSLWHACGRAGSGGYAVGGTPPPDTMMYVGWWYFC